MYFYPVMLDGWDEIANWLRLTCIQLLRVTMGFFSSTSGRGMLSVSVMIHLIVVSLFTHVTCVTPIYIYVWYIYTYMYTYNVVQNTLNVFQFLHVFHSLMIEQLL